MGWTLSGLNTRPGLLAVSLTHTALTRPLYILVDDAGWELHLEENCCFRRSWATPGVRHRCPVCRQVILDLSRADTPRKVLAEIANFDPLRAELTAANLGDELDNLWGRVNGTKLNSTNDEEALIRAWINHTVEERSGEPS